jgi:importin subunit beta-1
LKNTIYSVEEVSTTFKETKWMKLTPETRAYIKENSLAALGVDKKRPSLVGGLVSHLACVEIPRGMWPECMTRLMANASDAATPDTLKETSLETICFICQEIADIKVLEPFLDDLFTMIKTCIRSGSASDFIKLSALSVLTSSDALTNQFFATKKEKFERIVEIALGSEQSDDLKLATLKYFEKIVIKFVSSQKLNENLFKVSYFKICPINKCTESSNSTEKFGSLPWRQLDRRVKTLWFSRFTSGFTS